MRWRRAVGNWSAVVAVGAVLLVVAAAVAYVLAEQAEERTRADALRMAAARASIIGQLGGTLPVLTETELRGGLTRRAERRLREAVAELRARAALDSLTVIGRGGHVYFAEAERLTGTRLPLHAEWRAALSGRTVAADTRAEGHDELHALPHGEDVIESYVPVRSQGEIIGAVGATFDRTRLEALITDGSRQLYFLLIGAFLLLWLLAVPALIRLAQHFSPYDALRRQRTVRAFARGLRTGEVELYYQPQVDLESQGVCGAEALVRWRRGEDVVPPGEFLPHVEASRVIHRMTRFVIETAVAEAARWRAEGKEISVSVNLSGANLADGALTEHVAGVLRTHGLPAALLTLEVTETAVLDDGDQAAGVLAELAELGIGISIDDFGTGHSSLTRLHRLPIDEVKVDRSFVGDLATTERPFVSAIVQMANTLGLKSVAEGVEDELALALLREFGCDVAQGYHFSPPVPSDRFRQLLDTSFEVAPSACAAA